MNDESDIDSLLLDAFVRQWDRHSALPLTRDYIQPIISELDYVENVLIGRLHALCSNSRELVIRQVMDTMDV
jgi:uncharacterized protein